MGICSEETCLVAVATGSIGFCIFLRNKDALRSNTDAISGRKSIENNQRVVIHLSIEKNQCLTHPEKVSEV